MYKFYYILKREFKSIVRRKSFVLITILLPAFIFFSVFISGKFATSAPQRKLTVGVFGNDDILTYLYNNNVFSFIRINLNELENHQGKFDYIIKVPDNFPKNDSILIKINITGQFNSKYILIEVLRQAVINLKAHYEGISQETINRIFSYPNFKIEYNENVNITSEKAIPLPIILVVLLQISILTYGFTISRSIIEEKKNRIMEIVLSIITPKHLLAGKIFGIGLAAFIQVTIWISAFYFISKMKTDFTLIIFSFENLIYFFTFYIIGFTIYSQIYSITGAVFDDEKDAQQFYSILNMFLFLPFIAFPYILNNPDTIVSRILSFIPVFAPFLLYLRIVISKPHFLEILTGISISIISILIIQIASLKIFNVKLLLYGKKVTIREIFRSFTEK